ncbi:unnamed protein product, partial [Prorocentrum cordatum]
LSWPSWEGSWGSAAPPPSPSPPPPWVLPSPPPGPPKSGGRKAGPCRAMSEPWRPPRRPSERAPPSEGCCCCPRCWGRRPPAGAARPPRGRGSCRGWQAARGARARGPGRRGTGASSPRARTEDDALDLVVEARGVHGGGVASGDSGEPSDHEVARIHVRSGTAASFVFHASPPGWAGLPPVPRERELNLTVLLGDRRQSVEIFSFDSLHLPPQSELKHEAILQGTGAALSLGTGAAPSLGLARQGGGSLRQRAQARSATFTFRSASKFVVHAAASGPVSGGLVDFMLGPPAPTSRTAPAPCRAPRPPGAAGERAEGGLPAGGPRRRGLGDVLERHDLDGHHGHGHHGVDQRGAHHHDAVHGQPDPRRHPHREPDHRGAHVAAAAAGDRHAAAGGDQHEDQHGRCHEPDHRGAHAAAAAAADDDRHAAAAGDQYEDQHGRGHEPGTRGRACRGAGGAGACGRRQRAEAQLPGGAGRLGNAVVGPEEGVVLRARAARMRGDRLRGELLRGRGVRLLQGPRELGRGAPVPGGEDEASACERAHDLVLSQCPGCSECPLRSACPGAAPEAPPPEPPPDPRPPEPPPDPRPPEPQPPQRRPPDRQPRKPAQRPPQRHSPEPPPPSPERQKRPPTTQRQPRQPPTTQRPPPTTPRPAPVPGHDLPASDGADSYDCGGSEGCEAWTPDQHAWCLTKMGLAGWDKASVAAAASTSRPPARHAMDASACRAGAARSYEEKQMCCRHFAQGCRVLFPPYQCRGKEAPKEWSQEKQRWCFGGAGSG